MRTPTANELLAAWEQGLDQSPTRRALLLLTAGWSDIAPDKLAALPIGVRDARLLRLRELLFGDPVAAVSRCAACGNPLDVSFHVHDMRAEQIDAGEPEVLTHRLQVADYDIAFRLPASADILAVASLGEDAARRALISHCVVEARHAGAATAAGELPDTIVAALTDTMRKADPQAQIELAMTCPACGHDWIALFDIAAFLWHEVHAWAQRTLRDVDALARAYGWREADILAMSARRRQRYLDMVRS
jgi:hypothetical protein